MHLLSFAKGALAMFWLVALLNLLYPFAAPLNAWVNWAAGLVLLAHVAEVALLARRLNTRPSPWWERTQVLLFGMLHLPALR
ncbi:DUF1145 domain-containing protein [Pseudomonas sp. GD03944]|uniref:DUF1145 domain-containing protein n=1 Tax=Pseudomonas sp. GD03944 TaxID=2975409 RepID=UPI002448334F|nr:DUF1145 domain-containing protein [Pseudomonas sp. GD03944]MDH1261952.1 DUF1145 domain-containing protein [Pseudomonas sp. GD03944]